MWKCPKCNETLPDGHDVCWLCGTTKAGVQDPHFLDPEAGLAAPENEPLEDLPDDFLSERENMVTIAQCNKPAEAHALRLHLEAAGIPVFLADELTVAMDWLLSNAIGGVKVQVPEEYVEKATSLVEGFSGARDDAGDEDEDEDEETEEI